jgi:hypothetical protein
VRSNSIEGPDWQTVDERQPRQLLSRRVEKVPACIRPLSM